MDLIDRMREYASTRKGELAELITEAADALERQTCEDAVSRQAAIEYIKECAQAAHSNYEWDMEQGYINAIECLEELPSAQPEVKEIGYAECANAMLKMWIDNVLTDGEYNRVMDRLNAHHNAGRRRAESEEV